MSDDSTNKNPYRVAIVGGAGTWGSHYLEAFAARPDCQIALVDRARERRQTFADHYGVDAVFDSIEDMFTVEVPDIVQAVLPVRANREVVTACARAGVKVVACEKPVSAFLAEADEMRKVCAEHGTLFGCANGYWSSGSFPEVIQWIHEGHIGNITAMSIPTGFTKEVSGGGCVALAQLQWLTKMRVTWVEGWTLQPPEDWKVPEGEDPADLDCGAYGRMGLSGGIICEVPRPRPRLFATRTGLWIGCEDGQVWINHKGGAPVLIHGVGAEAGIVRPAFMDDPAATDSKRRFTGPAADLIHAFDTGELTGEAEMYCQALEIAVAFKLSAKRNHERVMLPLEDRTLQIYPNPYRYFGGDVTGWDGSGPRIR